MSMESLDELGQLMVAPDPTKALLGKEQRGGSPAQYHLGSTPALDPTGPGLCARKAALDQIGRTESSDQRFMQSQPRHRQRFFQAFLQTVRRAGADRLQPPHARTQLFECFFGRGFGPGST